MVDCRNGRMSLSPSSRQNDERYFKFDIRQPQGVRETDFVFLENVW